MDGKYNNAFIPVKRTVSRLAFFMAVFLFISLIAPAGIRAAESDSILINFSDPMYLDFISGTNGIRGVDFVLEEKDAFIRVFFNQVHSDPYFFLPIALVKSGISCDKYRYVVMNIRTDSVGFSSSIYFATSNDGSLNEDKNVGSVNRITDSGEWESMVFDMGANVRWNGLLTSARFDPFGTVPEGLDHIDIRWIAFVKAEKDLEKLDEKLKDIDKVPVYTRRPVFATPDRTKPPENTFRPSGLSGEEPDSKSGGFSPVVLITVTSVLAFFAASSLTAIIITRKKNKNGSWYGHERK